MSPSSITRSPSSRASATPLRSSRGIAAGISGRSARFWKSSSARGRSRSRRPYSERDGSPPELDHIAADTHSAVRSHLEVQKRRAPRLLTLHDLEAAGEPALERDAPPTEIGGGGAGRRIFQHRRSLREKEAREQRRRGGIGTPRISRREHISLVRASSAGESSQQVRPWTGPTHGFRALQRYDQLLAAGAHPQRTLADVPCLEAEHLRDRLLRLGDFPPLRCVGLKRPAVFLRGHGNQPGGHFERELVVAQAKRAAD